MGGIAKYCEAIFNLFSISRYVSVLVICYVLCCSGSIYLYAPVGDIFACLGYIYGALFILSYSPWLYLFRCFHRVYMYLLVFSGGSVL